MSESFDTRIARSVDARLASEDARERLCERPSDCLHPSCQCGSALPSLSGPDAETLAATVREGVSAAEVPLGVVSAAFSALSGLVALVEQRERERDEARKAAVTECGAAEEHRERAEKAEALLARHRQAIKTEDAARRAMYRTPTNDPALYEERSKAWETAACELRALSASAPGTEEPA